MAAFVQHQEQLTALKQVYDEQRQRYEILVKEYVTLRERVTGQEQALGELQQMGRYSLENT